MLHYFDGKPVSADYNRGFNVIHSHSNCTEWCEISTTLILVNCFSLSVSIDKWCGFMPFVGSLPSEYMAFSALPVIILWNNSMRNQTGPKPLTTCIVHNLLDSYFSHEPTI